MSLHEYRASVELAADDPPFAALIMAALRGADSGNAALIRAAWPGIAAETQARYDAPGGILASDPDAVEALAKVADSEAFARRVDGDTVHDDDLAERRQSARAWARWRLGLDPETATS